MNPERPVVVAIGAGGMGVATARRLGMGRTLVLGDVDADHLERVRATLSDDGHDVVALRVDVTSAESVSAFAERAAAEGRVVAVAHTAGVSPVGSSVDAVLAVDLLGTALVLDAFAAVVARGGAGVVVASMAGHLAGALGAEVESALATTPTADLLALPFLHEPAIRDNAAWAYMVAKRGNQLRVRAAAAAWGRRGARINSISPGVVSTGMGRAELDGESGSVMDQLVAGSATGRLGTPDDIAAAAEFLLGPGAGFVTGTDLLVDGGVVASVS